MSVHIVMTCIETASLLDLIDIMCMLSVEILACIPSIWPCLEKNSPSLMFLYCRMSLNCGLLGFDVIRSY